MAIREIKLGPTSRMVEQGTGAVRAGPEAPTASRAPAPPERANREGDQALPTEGEGDVISSLIRRLEERRAIGVRRYGTSLQAFNGRDPFRDHEEELLDQHNYAEQIRHEYNALAEALIVLWRHAMGRNQRKDLFDAAMSLGAKIEAVRRAP